MAARVFPMRKRTLPRKRHAISPAVFTADIVPGEDGWYVARCLEIPGCITQGRTIEEATANFSEALALCLEVLAGMAERKRRRPSRRSVARVRFALAPV